VTLRNRLRNVLRFTFASDDALLDAKDDLLEPLVANAVRALENGSERPADRSGRQKTTVHNTTVHNTTVHNTTTPVGRAARRPALRPAMLAVYAIAFATGFVFGPRLLLKSDVRPPMVPAQGHGVTQSTAPKFHALPRAQPVGRPQASFDSPHARPSAGHP
jgi:hypothetical protein